jgi:hypothetical protein
MDFVEHVADAVEEEQSAARETISELAAAKGEPTAADVRRARKAMDSLGLDPTELGSVVRLFQEARRLELAAADADNAELAGQIDEASQAWRDHDDETKRLAREREAEGATLFNRLRQLQSRRSQAHVAARQLRQLREHRAGLFGLPAPEPPPQPRCIFGRINDAPDKATVAGRREGPDVRMFGRLSEAAK